MQPKNLVAVAEGLMQKLKPKPKRKGMLSHVECKAAHKTQGPLADNYACAAANVLLSSSSDDDVCEETEPQKVLHKDSPNSHQPVCFYFCQPKSR